MLGKFKLNAIAFAIALVSASAACAQPAPDYPVQSGSMSPTAEGGEFLAVEPLRAEDVRLGDVVIYWSTGASGQRLAYVKRVVGLPGDRIAFHNGVLVTDGIEASRSDQGVRAADGHQWRVFRESLASREYLVQLVEDQAGRWRDMEEIEIPPGHVFVVGDSRDNSRDSRAEGPLPISEIVAKAVRISQSSDAERIGRQIE